MYVCRCKAGLLFSFYPPVMCVFCRETDAAAAAADDDDDDDDEETLLFPTRTPRG